MRCLLLGLSGKVIITESAVHNPYLANTSCSAGQ